MEVTGCCHDLEVHLVDALRAGEVVTVRRALLQPVLLQGERLSGLQRDPQAAYVDGAGRQVEVDVVGRSAG